MPVRFGPLLCIGAIAALLLPALPLGAQTALPSPSPSATPNYATALAQIAQDAPEAMRRQRAPGMVLALTDRTGTLAVLPFGLADIEHHVPVTASTRFGIGSITKSMTAIALLEARDRGRFDPQAPITRYLPWFSVHTKWRPLRGHDLLTHTSGLQDGGMGFGEPLDAYLLRDRATGFAPGSHWSYSNVGFETLGAVLEAVDRVSWSDAVRTGVLDRIGMNASATDWTFDTLAASATGYLPFDDERIPDPRAWPLAPVPTSIFVDPAGSVLSTGGDMARYARMLLNGGKLDDGTPLISASSYALLTHPFAKAGGNVPGIYQYYGYGLAVATLDGDTVVGHTGGTTPYVACMEADLTTGFAAVALTNIGSNADRPCAVVEHSLRILRAAALNKPLPALPPASDRAAVKNAAAYAGTYRVPGSGATLVVTAPQPDRLALVVAGELHPLLPLGGGIFWTDIPRFQYSGIRFIPDRAAHRANELVAEGRWYVTSGYHGPTRFSYPRAWNADVGYYRADGTPYDYSFRIQLVKGVLVLDDGTPLVPAGDGTFRIGTDTWSPERLRFDVVIGGHAQRATYSGVALGRVPMP
jgi:CubicO group peptidase (beta-lactamase class C family)